MPKLTTTLGQLAVNELLPPEFRDYSRQIDKKQLNALLSRLATERPELYRDTAHKLSQLGIRVAERTGGFTFGARHMRMAEVAKRNREKLQGELNQLLNDPHMDAKARNAAVIALASRYQKDEPKQVYAESLQDKNPLALQILSGSRGNVGNLASLRASSLLFADAKDEPVPVVVTRSYSQGLRPSEYWASTYGGRRSVMTTKLGIADSGYMGKQLVQAAHRLLVTKHDGPYDANGPLRGMPVDVDDNDNEGALLAHAAAGYPRNTILTPRILKDIKKQGVARILVRSPTVGGPDDGGVYARDVGIREFGRLPTLYEPVGISSAQSIGERLCVAKGTLVRMADGTEKPIEQVAPGDRVVGCDLAGKTTDVRVVALYDNGARQCQRYYTCSAEITCTAEHRLLASQGSSSQYDVRPAGLCHHVVQLVDGLPRVLPLRKHDGDVVTRTYDIEVDHPDHLFVLANGLVVHNSQVALSSKHGGGVAGSNKLLTGMPLFKALINTPKTLKGGAAHATVDGKVERIEDAPAGGQYVYIGGKRHYVSAGFGLHIKPGDTVEAGDVISEGIPNPAMVVQYKGVGEGRRYFTKLFGDALKNADIYTHRRNVELMARGLINHVELTDEVGEGIPGDIVPYQALESTWQPRAETRKLPVKAAVGKYLERPVLHYTIGTQVRPSVQRELEEFGINDVDVHDDPPPFTSTLVRADTQLQHDPDVITRMYGSHIRKSFLGAVHRGGSSDRAGTSFVPGLAYGLGFGTYGKVRTPKQAPPHPGWSTGEPLQTEVEMPQKKALRICPGCPKCPKCGSDETVPDREDGKILCYACEHVFKGRDKSAASRCPPCPHCGSDRTSHARTNGSGNATCSACRRIFTDPDYGRKAAAVKPTLAHTFDRPKGTKKTFETPDGKREVTYPVDYGYFDDIFNPEDGEEADVFVGSGDLCGRFMKGDNLSGDWKPDERKWYVGLTPEEFRDVMDMYRSNDDKNSELPSLIRDHVRFDDVRHLEDDVKLLPQRDLTKAADLATILPIIALLGTLGIQNLPALLQFFGIKNPFAGNNTGIAKGSPAAPPAPSPPVSSAGGDGGWLGSLGKDVSLRGMFNTAMGGVGTVAGGLGTLATAIPGTLAAGGQGLANMVGVGNTVRPYLDVPRNLNREMATATGNAYAQAAGGMTRGNTDFNQYMNGTLDNAANMAQAPNASLFDRTVSPVAERANALSQTATAAALARGAAPVMPGWLQSVTNAVTNPYGVAMSQAAPSAAVQSIPALKPYIGENALRQQGDQLRTLGHRMGASWLGNAAGAVYETAVPAAIDYGIFRGAAGLTGGARNAVSRGLGAAADYNKGMLTPSMGAVTGTLGAVAGTPAPLPTPHMPSISKPPDGHAPIQRARSAVPGF